MKIIISLILIINSTLFSLNLSSERKLINDFNDIPFSKSKKEIETYFSTFNPQNNKLFKVYEGEFDNIIKKKIIIPYYNIINQNLYDEDFTIFKKSKGFTFTLTHVNDYTLPKLFPFNKWNPLIKKLRLCFQKDLLFEKEAFLRLNKVSQALIILVVLKSNFGKPIVEESEIQYKGTNRFVWVKNNIKIEYVFSHAKNMFNQEIGYNAKLKMTHELMLENVNKHLRLINAKLIRILTSDQS